MVKVLIFLLFAVQLQHFVLGKLLLDKQCDHDLSNFENALKSRELWAVTMFDFWAKIQSGYLVGNTKNFGHFTECVNFHHQVTTAENIQGQHCMIKFKSTYNFLKISEETFEFNEIGRIAWNKSITLESGICLPASCSPSKVQTFINKFLQKADLEAVAVKCKTKKEIHFKIIDIVAIIIFTTITILLIASTTYDVIMRRRPDEVNKLFIAFSVYTNGRNLFALKKSKSSNSIRCLQGLRAMSIFWLILGHRVLNHLRFPMSNPSEASYQLQQFYSIIYGAHSLAVETFFVMGALLATCSTLNAIANKTLNIPRVILHRFLRYTPALAALTLFTASLYRFILSGPVSDSNDHTIYNCRDYWFSIIFHFQNYFNPKAVCLSHTWYLSLDFQLYIATIFLIYPAKRFGWKYLWILPVLAVASSVFVFIFSLKDEAVTSLFDKMYDLKLYYPTHARLGSWMVGVVLGYIFHTSKDKKIKVNKTFNAVGWMSALSLFTAIMIQYLPCYESFIEQSPILCSFLHATQRPAFAIVVAWIIFACHKLKTGGILKCFLELSLWQPIGRMGLSIYIVSYVYQKAIIISQKQVISFSMWQLLHEYSGDVIISIILSTVWYLTFEAPIVLVENYLFKKLKTNKNAT